MSLLIFILQERQTFYVMNSQLVWDLFIPKEKGETVYSIRAIPLGGYVSMAGEEVSDFVKIGNTLGVNLDEKGNVKEILLNNESKYDSIELLLIKIYTD